MLNREGGPTGRTAGKSGAVTSVQRFGSALNLNVHFHIVHPDGVYDRGADDALRFFQATPTTEDVEALAVDIATACERWLSSRGFSGEAQAYHRGGVEWYWLVDIPNRAVTVYRRTAGSYEIVVIAVGSEIVHLAPFDERDFVPERLFLRTREPAGDRRAAVRGRRVSTDGPEVPIAPTRNAQLKRTPKHL